MKRWVRCVYGISPFISIFSFDTTWVRHENSRMARQLGFRYPGAVYQVIARGHGGQRKELSVV